MFCPLQICDDRLFIGMGRNGSGTLARLQREPTCGRPWAAGRSFGLQGIYLFLEKTNAYTAPILESVCKNAVRALKTELPYCFREVLEGRLGICQTRGGSKVFFAKGMVGTRAWRWENAPENAET